jgi:CHAT domain-containing protein/tetratricopeptide (TPR) repeat protein
MLLSATVLALTLLGSRSARAQDVTENVSNEQMESILKGMGLEYVKKENTFTFELSGYGVALTNHQKNCLLYSYSKTPCSLRKINQWNKEKRFSRAYLDDDGDPCIEADLEFDGGVTRKAICEWIKTFRSSVRAFAEFIAAKESSNDKPQPSRPAAPSSRSEVDARLAEAERLNAEVVKLFGLGRCREATPKARQALAIREEVLGEKHPDTATSLNNLGAILQAQGDYAAAKPLHERALAIRERVLGRDHPDTATSLNNLAELLQAQGNYDAARPLYERALAINEQVKGREHPATAAALTNLAGLNWRQGNYAAAKPLFERALAIRERVLGKDHPDTAISLNCLAVLLEAQGDYTAAKPLFERALAIRERVLGKDHPDTATSLNNLAELLGAQGDYAAAKPLFERALAIRERVLGQNHPDTATCLNNLAGLLKAQGDYAAAKPLFERALAIRERVLGKDHPVTAISLNSLAALLQAQGDYAAAKQRYERALTILERVKGPNHPEVATCLNNLGTLLEEQGDYVAAKQRYERALAISERVLGKEHLDTTISLNNLALLLKKQGDYATAKPLYERALAIREQALGRDHPDTAICLDNLAGLLEAQGDYAAARLPRERALAIFERVLGRDHPDTAICLNNLAMLLHNQGDYAAAKPLYERSLAIRERVLGQNHPDTATCLDNLALLLQKQGDYAAAGLPCERALAIFERVLGRDHPDTAICLINLAALHRAQGHLDKAETLLQRALEISRGNLKLAAAAQSERQQLAMTQNLRHMLDAALSLDRQTKHTGDWAYRAVLSWKGSVFAQQRELRAFRQAVSRTGQPEVVGLFKQREETARHLATLALDVPTDLKQQPAWTRQIAELTEKKEHLEGELARRSAEFRRLQAHLDATPERVQAVLPDGVALVDLLEYTDSTPPPAGRGKWKWESRLVGFVVRRGRPIERLDLGPIKPIEQAIAAWRVALGADSPPAKPTASETASPAPAPRDRQELANQVRRLVWLPLEAHLEGIHTVLVSPDGALGRLPLAALPGQKPDTYLIEERAIALVPVPQDLPELLAKRSGDEQGPEAKEPTPSLLLVGDVDYGASPGLADTETSRVAARDKTRAGALGMFDQLPRTREEIVAVQDSFKERFEDGRVLLVRKAKATEATVRREVSHYRYLHLATHGFFNPQKLRSALAPESAGLGGPVGPGPQAIDPFGGRGVVGFHPGLLSGLALAGANRTPEQGQDDGVLTALEVAELDLAGVELVTLSACQTGLGQSAGGEGLLGLQRAFQVAGAHAVVATLWNVNDEKARSLMAGFYQNLWGQPPMGKLQALREAQLAMLRGERARAVTLLDEGQPAGRSDRVLPFYWAAFVLSGDWR